MNSRTNFAFQSIHKAHTIVQQISIAALRNKLIDQRGKIVSVLLNRTNLTDVEQLADQQSMLTFAKSFQH